MSSSARQLLRATELDFSALAPAVDIVVFDDIDVAAWGDATLVVRIHDNDTVAPSSWAVALYGRSFSPDDPSVDFVAGSPSASVTIDGTTPAGTLLMAGALPGFPACLQLRVTGDRQGTGSMRIVISAELVARRGVAAPRRSLADTLVVGSATGGTSLVVSSGDGIVPATDNGADLGSVLARFSTVHAGSAVQINNQPAARVIEALQISTLRI